MSIHWRFGRDDASAEPARAADEQDDRRPSRAQRVAMVLGVVGALALVVAGAHAWRNARMLDGIEDDVRAVVVAEEAARARGDGEVARMHQTAERRRQLRDSSSSPREALDGLPPPLPGLEVVGAGTVDGVDVAVGAGGRIERAEAELVYTVTDGEITGTFRAMRPMELDADGRWRHGLPETASTPPRSNLQPRRLVQASAPIEDRAWLDPALEQAEAIRRRYCRLVPCHNDVLSFQFTEHEDGNIPRFVGGDSGSPVVVLLAPSQSLRPVDAAATQLLERALVRMALALSIRQRSPSLAFSPSQLSGPGASFAVGLAEAALAVDEHPDRLELWAGPGPNVARTLDDIWPGTRQRLAASDDAPPSVPASETRRAARDFGAFIARTHGSDALAGLLQSLDGTAGPDVRWDAGGAWASPYPWLEMTLKDKASDAILNWPDAQLPAPSNLGLVATCLVPEGRGWVRSMPLLVTPGEAPRAIGAVLCGEQSPLAPPRASGGRVAAICSAGPQGNLSVALLEPDERVRRIELPGAPWPAVAKLEWSADGRSLAMMLNNLAGQGTFDIDIWVHSVGPEEADAAPRRLASIRLDVDSWDETSLYSALTWQPGGRLLAHVVPGADGPMVVAQDPAAPEPTWTLPGHTPSWSPDGRRLVAVRGISSRMLSLVVADADSGTVEFEITTDVAQAFDVVHRSFLELMDFQLPRVSWSPNGLWIAASLATSGEHGRLALAAWEPATDRLHVIEHDQAMYSRASWAATWHSDESVVFLTSNYLFDDKGPAFPWQDDLYSPPQLALDVSTGRTTLLEPGDPALEVFHWPLSPDSRWRVRRDEVGRLEVEPVDGGTTWRLNAPGCSVEVDWLEMAGG